jgi:hypothetical protein
VIPAKSTRVAIIRLRNRIERCFDKLKHFRRIATSLPFMSPAPYNGCLLNVSSAELASRAAASTCARRSALEQEGPLALIAGERGRVLELAPRLDHAADPE